MFGKVIKIIRVEESKIYKNVGLKVWSSLCAKFRTNWIETFNRYGEIYSQLGLFDRNNRFSNSFTNKNLGLRI